MRKGITLLELSMVILVLSILLGIMFPFYYQITSLSQRSEPEIKERVLAVSALDQMRTTLNRTFFIQDEKRLIFIGRKKPDGIHRNDSLTFAATHPDAFFTGKPEVREISFYVDSDSSGDKKLFRREDMMVDDKPGEGGAHYPLLDHVVSLEFRYSANGKTWYDEWDSRNFNKVPSLIQIRLRVTVNGRTELYESVSRIGLTE